jgi:hypothetical protein
MTLRPLGRWILVQLDPLETAVGHIVVPQGVDHRKATVEAVGPEVTDLQPGERVVFHRAHGEHQQGKQLLRGLGGDHLLIKPEDILFVFEGELEVA